MSQTIRLTNFSSNNTKATTRLDADAAVGATSVTVQNSQGFALNDFAIVGTPGAETTELTTLQAVVSSTALPITAGLKLPHSKYDLITSLVGNNLKVYRAPDVNGIQPADSAFTLISTLAIQPSQDYTDFTDPIGSNAYWYKYTFYNSVSSVETNLADSKAARGGGSGNYCSLDAIRLSAGFRHAKYITDDMIDAKRQAAQSEINGTLNGFYTIPFQAPINAFISDIATRLAAGLLLLEQYSGQISSGSTADGQSKVDEARDDLAKLVMKEVVLTDTMGVSAALPGSTGGASSWPDASTSVLNSNGDITTSTIGAGQDAGHIFKMSDIIGYSNRKY